jgi:hypothetical protein
LQPAQPRLPSFSFCATRRQVGPSRQALPLPPVGGSAAPHQGRRPTPTRPRLQTELLSRSEASPFTPPLQTVVSPP